MSESVERDIDIKDLPAEETLTPEEKERLAGDGRFRPTFEALETRQMMDGAMVGALAGTMAPSGGAGVAAGHVQTLETAPALKIVTPTEVLQGGATGAGNQQTDGGADPQSGPVQTPAVAPPGTKAETPAANKSSDQDDIRQKLAEIKQVVAILEAMDDPNLSYDEWLDGQSKKNLQLIATDKTELNLKLSEIERLKSQPEKATILADNEAELAIMKHKMAKMNDLQTAIEDAQQKQPGADRRVAKLTLEISHLELRLKEQQVHTLKDQIKISSPEKQASLQKLLEGEQYEVGQLKQIHELNEKIAHHVSRDSAHHLNKSGAHHVGKGGDADTLADLRCRVVQHELLMKQQNMRQLEARLKPTDGGEVQTPTTPANTVEG